MKKAVFVHDHVFRLAEDGRVFTSGKLPYAVWKRYLRFFDRLVVIGRKTDSFGGNIPTSDQEASGEGVDFVFAPNVATFKNRRKELRVATDIINAEIRAADIVIARTSELGRLAAGCAVNERKPYVAEVVGCAWDAYFSYGTILGKSYAPLGFVRQRRMVRNAPYALYVTQEWLQNRYPCDGFSMGISDVEIAKTSEHVLSKRVNRDKSGGRRTVVLGTNASLSSKYKGLRTAFRAVALLKKMCPGYKFEYRILGSGDPAPWQALAERYGIGDAVTFCGVVPSGGPVNDWLDEIDVYLQPSDTEGLPRALVEAMSRGCPCFASAVGGIPELLPKEVLHQRGDGRELALLLKRAITAESWCVSAAIRNFKKSKAYETHLLEKKRDNFWANVLLDVTKPNPR